MRLEESDTSTFSNIGSVSFRLVDMRRTAFLLIWFVFAVLFGFGAEAVLSGDLYSALRPADETAIAESASSGGELTEETSRVPQTLEFSGFQDVVFGLGIPNEPQSPTTDGRNSEIDAVMEYINKGCVGSLRSLYSVEDGLDTALLKPMSGSMCIA